MSSGRRFLAYHGQGDAEQDAEDHHLQDLAFRDGFRQVLGKDVQDGFRGGQPLYLERFAAGRRQVYSHACLAEVDGGESDDQRKGGDHLEVDNGLDAHAPHLLSGRSAPRFR